MRVRGRTPRFGTRALAGAAAALIAGLVVAVDQAPGATDTVGKTTVEQRIVPTQDPGFRTLQLGAGEGYVVREQQVGTAKSGRQQRRRSLLYLGQLSDFQLADEESPSRVEFVDYGPFSAAWRPWEAMNPQIDDAMIRQFNAFAQRSPVAAGDGSRRAMDLALNTGDNADSQQLNETEWVRTLMEGGTLNPGSGIDPATSTDPFCSAAKPLIADGAAPGNYTGVQDYDDYVEGATPQFYDPNAPTAAFTGWPAYPGLLDRAQQPFETAGLDVPSYVSFGNHDALVQGNAAANAGYESVATGCVKPMSPAVTDPDTFGTALGALDPAYLQSLLTTNPASVALVPPDPKRQYVSKQQYKAVFKTGTQADGHGFGLVDPDEEQASGGSAGYYSWTPQPGIRMISIDTVSEGGVIGPSADGNIDDPQFKWLTEELEAATKADELVILFSHHAIPSLTAAVPDESAPPCTGADSHGHDANPGCDLDPRDSQPIHLGDDVEQLLFEHPHVIAWIAGHSHVNSIEAHARPEGSGGFWSIRVAAEADWPMQARLLELFDNEDGTLSLFGTIVDHASNAAAPAPGPAASFSTEDLASIGRTIAYNDTQTGARACSPEPCGEGTAEDRNVELLVRDPRRDQSGAGSGGGGRPCENTIRGTRKRDRLAGTKAGDRIRGRAGNDRLSGKAGDDCIQGGRGGDRINGGKGRDTLKGGGGRDRIKARDGARDRVRCGPGRDRVKADRKDNVPKRSCERVKRRK
jgi:metallophosphoesterase (TIGR03767 family)